MSLDWRTKRKAMYLGIPLLSILLIAGFMTWRVYNSASCTDGRQNGGERGIDCEGPCSKICDARIKPLAVEWTRFAEVEPGRYNVMAVIENENKDLSARELSYTLSLYRDTELLWQEEGVTIVPAGVKFSVFAGPVRPTGTPTRATIEIGTPQWELTGETLPLEHVESIFSGLDTSPSLEARIRSPLPQELRNVEVGVALYDDQGNAVHLSNTVVPLISVRGEVRPVFTWPRPFDAITGVCTEPFDTMLLIDRSGSMNEDSIDPPEPLASVKRAALTFAQRIGREDSAGLVTFATGATLDAPLARGGGELRSAIQNVEILPGDEEGYTNIGDALKLGREELTDSGKGSIVLLTDGKANWPLDPTGEAYALRYATVVREAGIPLYSIGLGSGVDRASLVALSGDESRVFNAGTSEELDRIYAEIGTRLCNREPFLVEIYPKALYGEVRI